MNINDTNTVFIVLMSISLLGIIGFVGFLANFFTSERKNRLDKKESLVSYYKNEFVASPPKSVLQ